MQIAKDLAGFTPAEADDLRKAISKKVHALMASLREKFLAGCEANGVARAVAESLWEENERSADYSFNKAHAACYAMIAYRTAYLKANHPEPYMAALISSVMQTKDRVPFYVNACGEMGIEVLPPDVNSSGQDFTRRRGPHPLRPERGQGRGGGRGARDRAGARGGRPVHDALGLLRARGRPADQQARAGEPRQVRRPRLHGRDARGDAGGARGGRRRRAEDAGRRARRARPRSSTWAAVGEDEPQRHHPPVVGPELEKKELLAFEKETLGLYLTDHPLAEVADQLRRRVDLPLRELPNRREHETVSVGGLIASLRVTTSRSGDPMAFVRLDDGMTQVEVVVFGKVYGACREHLVEDAIVIIKGRVDRRDEGETKLRAIEIAAFEAVPARGEVRLRVDGRVAGALLRRASSRASSTSSRARPASSWRSRPTRASASAPRARLQGAARLGVLQRGARARRGGPARLTSPRSRSPAAARRLASSGSATRSAARPEPWTPAVHAYLEHVRKRRIHRCAAAARLRRARPPGARVHRGRGPRCAAGSLRELVLGRWPDAWRSDEALGAAGELAAAPARRGAGSARRTRTGACTTTRCARARSSATATPRPGTPSTATACQSPSSTSTRRARTRRCSTSPRAPGTSCRSPTRAPRRSSASARSPTARGSRRFSTPTASRDRSAFCDALQRVKAREAGYPRFWRLGAAADGRLSRPRRRAAPLAGRRSCRRSSAPCR